MKTLADIRADLSEQYDLVKGGKMEIQQSAELSNIHGKHLKAYALEIVEREHNSLLQRRMAATADGVKQIEHTN